MKKALLLLLGFLVALLCSELSIRYILGYPDYGVVSFVYGISSNIKWQAQYRPYSRYVNNEAGYQVFSRNNLGLPGIDVAKNEKPIFVLGSSFIEAGQVKPDKMAVSVFSEFVNLHYTEYTVMNLGRKAHDLYDSWFRYHYYKTFFAPYITICVLDQRNSYDRHPQPLKYDLPDGFGKADKSIKTLIGTKVLNFSSLLSLCYRGFRQALRESDPIPDDDSTSVDQADYLADKDNRMISSIKSCIMEFSKVAHDSLIIVPIFCQSELNEELQVFCDSLGVFCMASSSIQKAENQLNSFGHFNEKGNLELGTLLSKAFYEYMHKKKKEQVAFLR